MLKQAIVGGLISLFLAGVAGAQSCASYPNTLTNGTTADANQVMANFNCAVLTGNALFTGNVGIGTTTPGAQLDLGTAVTTIKVAAYNDGSAVYGMGVNSGELTFGSGLTSVSGTPQLVLTFAGYLGVRTTTPSYPLYVNGTAYASGAAGALSDIRHKDKVTPLGPGALETIGRLRPVTFVWKDPQDSGMEGEQIGFIAQDVVKVLPSVVLTEDNAEKTMGIKYTEIIPVLAKAIQEQQAEIEALRAEIAELKKPN